MEKKHVPTKYDRECLICGKQFTTLKIQQVYCGPECKEEANRRRARRKYQYNKDGTPVEWKQPRRCVICGKVFMPKKENNIVCGARTCRLRRQHIVQRGSDGPPPWKKERTCVICGKTFMPYVKTQVQCGDKECDRAYRIRKASERNHRISAARKAEREKRKQEAAEQTVAEPTLRDAIRMPKILRNKRGRPPRKGPKPGSIEWCVAEAEKRGMSYGQFVAAMESGVIEIDSRRKSQGKGRR